MQEIVLWCVEQGAGKQVAAPVKCVAQIAAESNLETLMVHNPEILYPNLRLVGRQANAEGGFIDLLGIDEDGKLVIFELKRGTLTREAVAQVVDYTSCLAEMGPEELAGHITRQSGRDGIEKIENFGEWYREFYPTTPNKYADQPRMVLVGLGADDKTQRMTKYLASYGVDISLITFFAYERDGKIFLAKHVNVKPPVTSLAEQSKKDKYALEKDLDALVGRLPIKKLFESIKAVISKTDSWNDIWPNKYGYTYYLLDRTEQGSLSARAYLGIFVNDKKPSQIQVIMQTRAIETAPQAFENLDGQFKFTSKKSYKEIWIKSEAEWESFKEPFQLFLNEMFNSWKNRGQDKDGA